MKKNHFKSVITATTLKMLNSLTSYASVSMTWENIDVNTVLQTFQCQFVIAFVIRNQLHISYSTFPRLQLKGKSSEPYERVLSNIATKTDPVLTNAPIFAYTSLNRAPDTKVYAVIEYISSTMRFDKPLV